MTNVRSLIEDFTTRLATLLESQTLERARHAVESALGVKHPGRPAKVSALVIGKKPRKKPPVQLCPVPGCRSPAAPRYGMVCTQHKDVSKTKIKKYREARRAKKLGIKPAKSTKRAKATKLPKRRAKKVARRPTVAAAKQTATTTPAT